MIVVVEVLLRKPSNSFYADNPFVINVDNKYYTIKLHHEGLTEFIASTIKKVELSKTELYITLKNESESPPTWYFDIMSLLINGKIFMIHKYIEQNIFSSVESTEFDYIDKKHRRKAKLERISSGVEIDPEKLWKTSWYQELLAQFEKNSITL